MDINVFKNTVLSQIGKTTYYYFQKHYKTKYKATEEKLIFQYLVSHVSDLFLYQPTILVITPQIFKEIGLLNSEDSFEDFFLLFELHKNIIYLFLKNFRKKIFQLEENNYEEKEKTSFLF